MKIETRFSRGGKFLEIKVDTQEDDIFTIDEAQQQIENLESIIDDLHKLIEIKIRRSKDEN